MDQGPPAWEPLLEPFRARRETAGLFLDFDGTLAEIAGHPESAQPIPGVVPLLEQLAGSYALVAVLSGRPNREIRRLVPSRRVEVLGFYGMVDPVGSRSSVQAIAPAVRAVAGAIPGTLVEDKGSAIAVHYRGAPDASAAERRLAPALRALADRSRMGLLRGKMVFELLPLDATGKGGALVREVVAHDLTGCLFAGDDLADLDAFLAMDRLRDGRVDGLRVAVRSAETPAQLCAAADLVVDGPEGLLELLRALGRP